ncbi:MAG: redox-sensing transcriptional repressor Rex [Pirellulales bacterium]|nr:redox-sensing transcriptional repressor Rex [Pirellulales bacterium]
MPEDTGKFAPLPSIRRLPAYLRLLQSLRADGRDVVSCTHIGKELGLVCTQVRKDLAVTGIVGKPKVGYNVPALIASIEEFLGWNNPQDAFLVGVGSLGRALMGYQGFQEYGLRIVAGFDVDPAKIGVEVHGKKVFPLEELGNTAAEMRVLVGVLTVPAAAAQDAARSMVQAGIRAIWNYTPATLEVPPSVVVEDVKLSASLAVLSSRLAESLRREKTESV